MPWRNPCPRWARNALKPSTTRTHGSRCRCGLANRARLPRSPRSFAPERACRVWRFAWREAPPAPARILERACPARARAPRRRRARRRAGRAGRPPVAAGPCRERAAFGHAAEAARPGRAHARAAVRDRGAAQNRRRRGAGRRPEGAPSIVGAARAVREIGAADRRRLRRARHGPRRQREFRRVAALGDRSPARSRRPPRKVPHQRAGHAGRGARRSELRRPGGRCQAMSARGLALYAAWGLAAYVIAFVALAPAAWLAQSVARASQQRLELRDAAGSAWSGSGRLYARTRAGEFLDLGSVRWKSHPTALLRGRLAADMTVNQSPKPIRVELSPYAVTLKDLALEVPAKALGTRARPVRRPAARRRLGPRPRHGGVARYPLRARFGRRARLAGRPAARRGKPRRHRAWPP